MALVSVLVLVMLLRVLLCLVTEGSLIDGSIHSSIRLGARLTTDTNSSWPSPSGLFAFGFYKQDNGFAVGIWLATKPEITVVWTANRDHPPLSSNSTIELSGDGRLLLHTTDGEQIDLIQEMKYPATSASMYDSGNFVLNNDYYGNWQTFGVASSDVSDTSDTILGGQQLGKDGNLFSSVSASQHSFGRFRLAMQSDGNLVAGPLNRSWVPEDVYWDTGAVPSGGIKLKLLLNGSLHLVRESNETLVRELYSPTTTSSIINNETTVVFRATLNPEGNFVLYSHIFTSPSSNVTRMTKEWSAFQDPCQVKGICGINSYCNSTGDKAECYCFPGFFFLNGSTNGRCYRNFTDEEACSTQITRPPLKLFYNITVVENMELGVFPYSVMNNLSKEACGNSCLEDCNCWVALYADGSCKLNMVPIIYAVHKKSTPAPTVFIKTSYRLNDEPQNVPAPPNQNQSEVEVERITLVRVIAVTFGILALMCTLVALSSFFYYRVHARRYQSISPVDFELFSDHSTLRSFSFDELQKATDGFKEVIATNTTAEVYKGFISDGNKAVAVKKLLQHNMMFEKGGFRAEITAIAQTHHRNLVRLLGFCIHGATKLLVYEFMSNGSLADLLLTQPPAFKERMKVALDVARGIFYLHEECETRIIHCNIKPHNILFDESWTAKISDFGLSKLLRPNQSGTLTGVRGTKGYLAPEWLKNTLITTKVDIYSFGVVLLEILCCTSHDTGEITSIMPSDDDIKPLSTWVYNCFVAKELNKLIGDEDEVDREILERMVKVGLLCIQDDQDARPSSKDVILMLEGTTDIPIPPSPTPPLLI